MQSSPAELLGVVAEVGGGHELLADLVLALGPRSLPAVRLAAVADGGGELARRSEIFLLVSRSQRPRNSVVSQLPSMMSALSLYIFLSCVTDCRMAVM